MELQYYCDNKRHLVCKPYSIANLHIMAKELNIKRCWFHKTHYDITKLRISEITNKCNVVSSKEIVNIIKEDQSQIKIDMEFETIRKPSKAFHKIIQAPLCKNKTKGSKKP